MKVHRITVGDGIALQRKSNWYELGRLCVNILHLEAHILQIRYKCGAQHNKFLTKQKISHELYNVLTMLIDTGSIEYTLCQQLNSDERTIFNDIIKYSKLTTQLKYKPLEIVPDKIFYKRRYNILSGEMESGNDSPIVKNELYMVINELGKMEVFSPDETKEMIDELNSI